MVQNRFNPVYHDGKRGFLFSAAGLNEWFSSTVTRLSANNPREIPLEDANEIYKAAL